MWETGYAMALGKPTILIGQDTASLPFDLRTHRALDYSPSDMVAFRPRLEKAIRDTLARYELKGTPVVELPRPTKGAQSVIAVTGSMIANEAAASRRIGHVLSAYLSERTAWLVGSVGTVDLTSIRFLLDRHQDVTAVGYHRFDCAAELRPEIAGGRLKFLDASVEVIPRRMEGPTERDILFCTKSDLVILFWDGKSRTTGELIHYFQDQGVSTLVAFI